MLENLLQDKVVYGLIPQLYFMIGKRNNYFNILMLVLVALTLAFCSIIFKQYLSKGKYGNSNNLNIESELLKSSQNQSLAIFTQSVLQKVTEELNTNPTGSLSNATISRIEALSLAFQPYKYLKEDSLSTMMFSPERGQLFWTLAHLKMDSVSWKKILRRVNFSFADLEGLDLSGMNLKGINLEMANLRAAKMIGMDLSQANLTGTNLWGAILDSTKFTNTDLTRADLRWAKLRHVLLDSARIEGAQAEDANFRYSNLKGASFRWANLNGADLSYADLENADLSGTSLYKTNIRNTNLTAVSLNLSKLKETNLIETELENIFVHENEWISKLREWNIIGYSQIQEKYKMVPDEKYPHKSRLISQ